MRTTGLALAALLVAAAASPCTTFCMAKEGEVLFGRNYDFEIGQAYVMTNRRGVAKTSMAGTLQWTSKYGSVTFNQWGREFPMDGMNDAGLVIALMWLDDTVYPRDERPVLRVLEWIQYHLDNYSSVAELLAHVEETRISPNGTPLHYLIADATGASATIEYLNGRLVVHDGAVLANDTYESSAAYLGSRRSMPSGSSSLDRFARASMLMGTAAPTVDAAFDILSRVAQQGATRWSVVYDTRRREVHWVTDRSRVRKTIRMDELALDCAAQPKMLDAHATTSEWENYSAAANRDLVVSSYATTSFTRGQPRAWAEADAAHAESFGCAGVRRRSVTR